jgi:hypothetical protein
MQTHAPVAVFTRRESLPPWKVQTVVRHFALRGPVSFKPWFSK